APAGMLTAVSGAAYAAAAGTSTLTVIKLITMTHLKTVLIGATAVVAAVAAPIGIQHQAQVKLHEENQSLRQRVDQLQGLADENKRLANLVAQADRTASLNQEQMNDLLRLRSEVGNLRQQNQEVTKLREENRQLRARP